MIARAISTVEDLQAFVDVHAKWARETFPDHTAKDKMEHAQEECWEIVQNKEDIMEYADVALLLLEVLTDTGYKVEHLLDAMQRKHEICLQRTWENGRHVKAKSATVGGDSHHGDRK